MKRFLASLIFAALGAMPGCCTAPRAATLEPIAYEQYADAVRLTNGTVEVWVVPSIGRIVHYGFCGEPNVLWTLPNAPQHAALTATWINYGGDKLWLWPQEDWKPRAGRTWPPPADGMPCQITWKAGTLTLTSPPIPGYPLRMVRDISLAPAGGTQVTIRNRLEPLTPGAFKPVAAWTVTQVPAAAVVHATPNQPIGLAAVLPLADPTPTPVEVEPNGNLAVRRDPARPHKVRLEASRLEIRHHGYRFTQQATLPAAAGGNGPIAQIFFQSDNSREIPPGMSPYAELEFAAPLTADGASELLVTWQLLRN